MHLNRLQRSSRFPSQFPLLFGLIAVFLSLIPTLLLGEKGYFSIPDQLDGEALVYIIHARNTFSSSFPEFMSGMQASALTPPAYGCLIFYWLMPPSAAFIANYVLTAVVAFVGMYLLLSELSNYKWLSALVALMFSQLPFFSVYGLSVMGQPLLFYACLRLWKSKKPWVSIAITVFFALFSSLVLIGFADVLILLIFSLVMQLRKHSHARFAWIQTATLVTVYIVLNLSLIKQILLPSDLLLHRAELVVSYTNAWTSFKSMFTEGAYHAVSLHGWMIKWVGVALLLGFVFFKYLKKDERSHLFGIAALFVTALGIAGFYSLWHAAPVVNLRNQLGGLFTSFQIDRFYWLYPALWFLIFALVLALLLYVAKRTLVHKIVSCLCVCLLVGNMGITLYNHSLFRENTQILLGNQVSTSWNGFYSESLFEEIEQYIGLPQEDYRVGSIALYPAVPLYNGFYCIDGYSNNYSLEYKHEFREIIKAELEKSESLRKYFDDWGNRCYIFSADLGRNYYFTKDSTDTIENLELSAEALQNLNCSYIFSGIEIQNPHISGLEFVKTFENETSPYRIWLYQVIEN